MNRPAPVLLLAALAPAAFGAKPAPLPPGVVARVDAVSIPLADITNRLWREQGPLVVEYRVRDAIIRDESRKRGITLSADELRQAMLEFRTAFMQARGRQPKDYEELIHRLGAKAIETSVTIQQLTVKLGDDEAAKTTLTPEETAHVDHGLERAAHAVHARQILVGIGPEFGGRTEADALARAREAQAKLAAGAAWDAVAKDYSDDVSTRDKGGDLGFFTREQMDAPLESAAFGMADNAVSPQPVRTAAGFAVVQTLAHRDTPSTPDQRAKALADALTRKKEIARDPNTWLPRLRAARKIVTEMPYSRAPGHDALPAGLVATVDGTPIKQADIQDYLWRAAGGPITDRVVNGEIVLLEAARRGLAPTASEANAKAEAFKRQISGVAVAGEALNQDRIRRFMDRYGQKDFERDMRVQAASDKLGTDFSTKAKLTPEETKAVRHAADIQDHLIHFRHITVGFGPDFGNRTDADALARVKLAQAELKSGVKWEDVVRKYSDNVADRDSGGDFGLLDKDHVDPAAWTAATAAKPGDVLPNAVKTNSGYEILQVQEQKTTVVTDQMRDAAVIAALQQKRAILADPTGWFPLIRPRHTVVERLPYEQEAARNDSAIG